MNRWVTTSTMMIRFLSWVALTLLALFPGSVSVFAQYSVVSIDDPLATRGTVAYGIDGENVVGYYADNNGPTAFVYENGTYTTLNGPYSSMIAYGISGNDIVGTYVTSVDYQSIYHGLLYDGNSYSTIAAPAGTTNLFATAISGSTIGGYYDDSTGTHGFTLQGGVFTTLNDPLGTGTVATGVSGDNVVGYYATYSQDYGFIYNGSTFTTIYDPKTQFWGTFPAGISGNDVVGSYGAGTSNNTFLFDGSGYTDLSILPNDTTVTGISGQNLTGYYLNDSGTLSGFLAETVPEPSIPSLVVLALGVLMFCRFRRSQFLR